jgi:hypothetical protein
MALGLKSTAAPGGRGARGEMTRGRACEEGSSEVKWMLPSTTCSRGVGPMTAADGGEAATVRWSGDWRRESGRVRVCADRGARSPGDRALTGGPGPGLNFQMIFNCNNFKNTKHNVKNNETF